MKPTPFRGATIAGTWVALLGLAALSFGLSYAHLGRAAFLVAMLIAALKVLLVLFIFMELALERASVRVAISVALLFVVILTAFVVEDARMRPPSPPFPRLPAGPP